MLFTFSQLHLLLFTAFQLSMGVALLAVSSFTNGSTNLPLSFLGKNGKCTTSKASGDCYIPTRNNKQMDLGSFLLSKKNEPMATNPSTATSVRLFNIAHQHI